MMDARVRFFLLAVSGNVTMPSDKYIRIGNINTRYWEEGEKGSPVILIHGLIGFCSHFLTVTKGVG
jgi:hypothetical protein